jgi:hypothetical protein
VFNYDGPDWPASLRHHWARMSTTSILTGRPPVIQVSAETVYEKARACVSDAGPPVQLGAGLVIDLLASKASRGFFGPPSPPPEDSLSPGKLSSMGDKERHDRDLTFTNFIDHGDRNAGLAIDRASGKRDVVVEL